MFFDIQRFATNKVPELINDYHVYEEGNDVFEGAKTVEVSGITTKTAEVAGIGITGTIDAPVLGQFDSIETKINWNIPTQKAISITGGVPSKLEIYAAVQCWDSGQSEYIIQQLKITVRGRGKSYEPGTFEQANTMDGSSTIETTFLKYELDGKETLCIDKYNGIFRVNGVDQRADIRKAIGKN